MVSQQTLTLLCLSSILSIPANRKGKSMKLFVIGILIAIGILDTLLVVGCAKLERMREENERDNRKV